MQKGASFNLKAFKAQIQSAIQAGHAQYGFVHGAPAVHAPRCLPRESCSLARDATTSTHLPRNDVDRRRNTK